MCFRERHAPNQRPPLPHPHNPHRACTLSTGTRACSCGPAAQFPVSQTPFVMVCGPARALDTRYRCHTTPRPWLPCWCSHTRIADDILVAVSLQRGCNRPCKLCTDLTGRGCTEYANRFSFCEDCYALTSRWLPASLPFAVPETASAQFRRELAWLRYSVSLLS